MDRRFLGVVTGVIIPAVVSIGIFFVPEEPLKLQVYLASVLHGALTGLLLGAVLRGSERWLITLVVGTVLGSLMGLTVSLSKGLSGAPFAVPMVAMEGLIVAAVLKRFCKTRHLPGVRDGD